MIGTLWYELLLWFPRPRTKVKELFNEEPLLSGRFFWRGAGIGNCADKSEKLIRKLWVYKNQKLQTTKIVVPFSFRVLFFLTYRSKFLNFLVASISPEMYITKPNMLSKESLMLGQALVSGELLRMILWNWPLNPFGMWQLWVELARLLNNAGIGEAENFFWIWICTVVVPDQINSEELMLKQFPVVYTYTYVSHFHSIQAEGMFLLI